MAAALEQLQEFCAARRWSHAAAEFKRLASQIDGADAKVLADLLAEVFPRMHPITAADTAVAVARALPPADAISILTAAHAHIESRAVNEQAYRHERQALQIHTALARVAAGDLEDREAEIFTWRRQTELEAPEESRLSPENTVQLHLLGYEYYSRAGDVVEAQRALLAYMEASPENSEALIQRLVELSLASPSFFDFTAVAALPAFAQLSDGPLHRLFCAAQAGQADSLAEHRAEIARVAASAAGTERAAECARGIVEKVQMVAVVNFCFHQQTKAARLDELSAVLRLDETELMRLLVRVLGIGLVGGWLDTEHGLLYFDRLAPRRLSAGEIAEMSAKYQSWRERVQRVIDTIKTRD